MDGILELKGFPRGDDAERKHTHVATASTASGTNEQKITTAPSCSRMPILILDILISLH